MTIGYRTADGRREGTNAISGLFGLRGEEEKEGRREKISERSVHMAEGGQDPRPIRRESARRDERVRDVIVLSFSHVDQG
jgi:hypothetical protein